MRPLCDPDIKGFAINVKKKITGAPPRGAPSRAKPFFNRIVLEVPRLFSSPRDRLSVLIVVFVSLALPSCRAKRAAAVPTPVNIGFRESGLASWYGHPYHGRPTASGEIYDMNRLTAAHRRLPLGVTARVTNLSNQKTVDVRINDRGPFVKGRIIDLSRAAAERLDMVRAGIAEVRLEVIRLTTPRRFAWQAGAFRERVRAETLARQLEQRACPVTRVVAFSDSKGVSLYKVLVGEVERAADLEPHRSCLNPDAADARVVPLDN